MFGGIILLHHFCLKCVGPIQLIIEIIDNTITDWINLGLSGYLKI